MKRSLLLCALSLLLLSLAAASAQPLKAKASYKISFKPTLVSRTVESGYQEGDVLYSDTIQLQWGLKQVEPHP